MSYDLGLGFRKDPADLGEVLSKLGFKHKSTANIFGSRCSTYTFYREGRSKCPIEISSSSKIEDTEFWGDIDPSVVAEATVTARGETGTFDFHKQMRIAQYLRDHYGAILIDPQEDDKEKMIIRDLVQL